MKKALFAALAGAVVLAGCAKTEVVKTSDSVNIRFDNAYVGNPTKATINLTTSTFSPTQMKTQISSTMRECTRITVCTLMMF